VPQSKTRKKPVRPQRHAGHPDPVVRRIGALAEEAVELVKELYPRLTAEQWLELRSAALGLLITEAVLTNMPDPRELTPVPGHTPPPRGDSHV
jgi:hypothetical protein